MVIIYWLKKLLFINKLNIIIINYIILYINQSLFNHSYLSFYYNDKKYLILLLIVFFIIRILSYNLSICKHNSTIIYYLSWYN